MADASNADDRETEQESRCVLCGNSYLYVSPYRLQCAHILCDDCGAQVKNNAHFPCPICSRANAAIKQRLQTVSIKLSSVTKQQKRQSLRMTADNYVDMNDLHGTLARRCELGKHTVQAQNWCEDCGKWMCDDCLDVHEKIAADHVVKPLAEMMIRTRQTIKAQVDSLSDNITELDFIEEACSDALRRVDAQQRDVSTSLQELREFYKRSIDEFMDAKLQHCTEFVAPIRQRLQRKLSDIHAQKARCEAIAKQIEALVDRNDNRLPVEGNRLVKEMQQCLGQTQSLGGLMQASVALTQSNLRLDLSAMISLELRQSPLIEVGVQVCPSYFDPNIKSES